MNWPIAPLSSLCSVRIGRTPRRDTQAYWGGNAVWVTIRELNGGIITDSKEHISDLAVREVMPPPIPAGTLLFSFKLSIGKMGIAGVPLYTNEAIASLEIKPSASVTPEFLRYALTACSSEAGANHAVLGKVLNKAKVESLPIPLPPLGEQQRIVDILSRAEGIVRLRREAQQKAAEIIPALFLDTFGDPATNPKGWPLRSFSELGSLDRGRSRHRPRDAEELYDGPYPFIQTGDVANSGGLIARYTSTYSEAGLAQSRLWSKGTLCITIAANIAQTGVLDFDACFPDSVVGFVGGDDVTTEYIQVWLAFLQPSLEAYAPQVAQKNINLDILRKLPVMSPPLALQEQFTARYNQLLALRKLHESSLEAAQATFDALLAQSFAPRTSQQAAA